jgi:hypothetical protein
MDEDCEHDWRVGPVTHHLLLRRQAVCMKGWHLGELPWSESAKWPQWTDADYEANKEIVERVFG